MSEDRLHNDMQRASHAKQLIEDELLKDTFDYLERSYIQAWKASKDPAAREANWNRVDALESVRGHLASVLNDGILARHQIQELVRKRRN